MSHTIITATTTAPTLWCLLLLSAVLILASCVVHTAHHSPYKNWAAYYAADAKPEEFRGYDLVIFDADQHPDIYAVKQQGSKVLAYLSIAEITSNRIYADRFLNQSNIMLGYNERWHSYMIDVRDANWQQFVVQQWLPEITAKGFDGVFVDTLDTALMQQQQFPGMNQATISMIKQIKQSMPKHKLLMVNRGFDILPDIASDVDIILAESILVDAAKTERPFVPPHVYNYYVDNLQQLRKKHPHLSIFTLDYPKTIDKTTWSHICQTHYRQGFIPFIATIDLQQIRPPFLRCI